MTKQTARFTDLADKLRSMGHPARVAILNLLCTSRGNKLTVKSIYETLKLDQPSVSRHLNIMKNTGVLERIPSKGKIYYQISSDPDIKCIQKCFK